MKDAGVMLDHDRLTVRVSRRHAEAAGICSFELVDPGAAPLPPFSAGAHIDVCLANGMVRQYSLCGDPLDRHRYLIAVLKAPDSRGGSRSLHEQIRPGALIRISRPRNHFELVPHARESLLIAGGIGITPLLGMARVLSRAGGDFRLHYLVRSRDRAAFRDEILAGPFADRVHFHFDDEPPKADIAALLAEPRPHRHLYVCGPGGLIEHVRGTAAQAGWPEGQVHAEFFAAQAGASGADRAFHVRIGSTGRLIEVGPRQTVLDALLNQGIEVLYSCEQGVCGSCITPVLAGVPDHRDHFLTAEEQAANDRFAPCCSRAHSDLLVLDI